MKSRNRLENTSPHLRLLREQIHALIVTASSRLCFLQVAICGSLAGADAAVCVCARVCVFLCVARQPWSERVEDAGRKQKHIT